MPIRSPLRAAALFAFVAAMTLVLDLATKRWAEALQAPRAAIDGVARFTLAHNPYGAGSFMRSVPENIRMPVLLGASVFALAVLAALYARTQSIVGRLGVALIAGGALGNLADRVRLGYVVDFIDVSATFRGAEHHWPTFNVADVAICTGMALLLLGGATWTRTPARP